MLDRGWPTVRMSGGDFKVLLRLADGRTCYVDVFVAFYVDGVFYQLGNRSGHLPREAVVPTSTVVLEGVRLPAPADPEAMLAFVYGPGWRVPDPSFHFTDPPAGVRRLDGWLRGFRTELPAWNEFFRSPRAADVPKKRSDFAVWAARRIARGDTLVELGSGTGRDAAFFARAGPPGARLRRVTRRPQPDPAPAAQAHCHVRTTADAQRDAHGRPHRRGGRTAGRPRHVYARGLLGSVDAEARRNLWRLARMGLHGTGGHLFLEFSATRPGLIDPRRPTGAGASPGRRRRGRRDRGVRRPRRRPRGRPGRPTCSTRPTPGPAGCRSPSSPTVPEAPMSDTTTRRPCPRRRRTTAEARGAGLRARITPARGRPAGEPSAQPSDRRADRPGRRLLVPLARREDEAVDEVLARYRSHLAVSSPSQPVVRHLDPPVLLRLGSPRRGWRRRPGPGRRRCPPPACR